MARRLVILAAVIVGLAAITLILRRSPEPTATSSAAARRHEVLARVGGRPGADVNPPVEAHRVLLGTSTRLAFAAKPEAIWHITMPKGATRITFSIGSESPSSSATFRISRRVGGNWSPIFERRVSSKAWSDHIVDLEANPSAQELQLQVTDAADGESGLFWGSIAILGNASGRLPPAVVVIVLDTLGAGHLSAYGNDPGVSPRIDQFLNNATTFDAAYAQYPNTLVSHASLFTGLYPRRHGVFPSTPTLTHLSLASALAERGYITAAFTEDAYVGSEFGFDQGFDHFDNGRAGFAEDFSGDAAETFAHATRWLDVVGDSAPVFLFVQTYEVHTPYTLRDEAARRLVDRLDPGYKGAFATSYGGRIVELAFNKGEFPLPAFELRHLAALHAGEINYLDRQLDTFLAAIAARTSPDTLIVLTSDHGEEFGEHAKLGHGETLHAAPLHVPLAFGWRQNPRPIRIATPVELIDVAPTLAELGGASLPDVDGRSLAAIVAGNATAIAERPGFAELQSAWGECERMHLAPDCRLDQVAVRSGNLRLISSTLPKFTRLYDLASDPGETKDLAATHALDAQRLSELVAGYRQGRPVSAATTPGKTIDAATRERLRALGYVP